MQKTVRKILSFGLALLFCSPAFATTYIVDIAGNDANDGLTLGTAWATIEHACDVIVAGDTVRVKGDGDPNTMDYFGANTCEVDGAEGARIFFQAYDMADWPSLGYKAPYSGGWTNTSGNLWQTTSTIGNSNNDIYGMYALNTTTGAVTVHLKEFSTGAVDTNGDFYAYKGTAPADKILIYSTVDPNTWTEEIYFVGANTGSTPITPSGDYQTWIGFKTGFSWQGVSITAGTKRFTLMDYEGFYTPNRNIMVSLAAPPATQTQYITLINVETHHSYPSWAGYSQAPDGHGIKVGNNSVVAMSEPLNLLILDSRSHNNDYHGLQISEGSQGIVVHGGSYHDNNLRNHTDGADVRIGVQNVGRSYRVSGVETYGTKYGFNFFGDLNDFQASGNYNHDALLANVYLDSSTTPASCSEGTCYYINNVNTLSDDAGVLFDDSERWTVANNTIVKNVGPQVEFLLNSEGPDAGSLYNNVIIGDTLIEHPSTGPTFTSNYNAFYSTQPTPFVHEGVAYNFADWKTQTSQDANSINSDFTAQFVDYTNGNYAITSASTSLKDAGLSISAIKRDYRRLKRPQGAGYSIGAFEEGGAVSFQGLTLEGVTV